MASNVSFNQTQACQRVAHEWAESMDTKDWRRLQLCLAPIVDVDYSSIAGFKDSEMSSESYVALVSSESVLGNPLIKTQHLLGSTSWQRISDATTIGRHQIRAAHQRYGDGSLERVVAHGHTHGLNVFTYEEIQGKWKLRRLQALARWVEGDLRQVFKSLL